MAEELRPRLPGLVFTFVMAAVAAALVILILWAGGQPPEAPLPTPTTIHLLTTGA